MNWKCRPLKFRLKINVNFLTYNKLSTDLRGYYLLGCVVFCSSGHLPAFWKNTKANLVMTGYKGGCTYDTSTSCPLCIWCGEDVRDRTVYRLIVLLIMSGFLILDN